MFIAIQQVSRLAGNPWNARTFLCRARVCTPPTDPDPGRLILIPGRRSRVRSAAWAAHVRLPRRLYSRCSPHGALILIDSWQDCQKPLLFSTLLYFIPILLHPIAILFLYSMYSTASYYILSPSSWTAAATCPRPTRPQCLSMFYQCFPLGSHHSATTRSSIRRHVGAPTFSPTPGRSQL